MQETKISATLPTLDIEMVHRDHPDERAESMTIRLTARPNFEAAAGLLPPLMAAQLASMPSNPLALWAEWTRMVWAPWMKFAGLAYRLPYQGWPPPGPPGNSDERRG